MTYRSPFALPPSPKAPFLPRRNLLTPLPFPAHAHHSASLLLTTSPFQYSFLKIIYGFAFLLPPASAARPGSRLRGSQLLAPPGSQLWAPNPHPCFNYFRGHRILRYVRHTTRAAKLATQTTSFGSLARTSAIPFRGSVHAPFSAIMHPLHRAHASRGSTGGKEA